MRGFDIPLEQREAGEEAEQDRLARLDVPKRTCPWCKEAIGPITGIHWARAANGDDNSPNSTEECELRTLRALVDEALVVPPAPNTSVTFNFTDWLRRARAIRSESQKQGVA